MTKDDIKIGDRVKNKRVSHDEIGIVTEITERGFKFDLISPCPFIPRMGLNVIGGEVFLESEYQQKYCNWEKVDK
jgi:hypothetical protein